MMLRFGFSKKERLCSEKDIDVLFAKGKRISRSIEGNTLRCVCLVREEGQGLQVCAVSRVLISVPKKNLKRATDRNRVKRLIREAYRLEKYILGAVIADIAFIYNGSASVPFADIRTMLNFHLKKIASI
ncbi:MAG: ribonuclease P protein component [Bacteroidales bacterium]|jgi:ribonuclease P protein component|nr:ribonuclease P protein component [Bacteroidales bacterium]